jgi:hypothetical protein
MTKFPEHIKELEDLSLQDFFKIFNQQKKIMLIVVVIVTFIFAIYSYQRNESISHSSSSVVELGTYNNQSIVNTGDLKEDIFYLFNVDISIVMRSLLKIDTSSSNSVESKETNEKIVEYILEKSSKEGLRLINDDQLIIDQELLSLSILTDRREQINNLDKNEIEILLALTNLDIKIKDIKSNIYFAELAINSYVPSVLSVKPESSLVSKSRSKSEIILTGFVIGLILSSILAIGLYKNNK